MEEVDCTSGGTSTQNYSYRCDALSCPDTSTGTAGGCTPPPSPVPCHEGTMYWSIVCYRLDPASMPPAKITNAVWTAVNDPNNIDYPGTCERTYSLKCMYDSNNTQQSTVGLADCMNFNAP